MNKKLYGWLLLFACNLMWSFHFTAIVLVKDQAGPYFTVWGPMLLSLLFLFPPVYKEFRQKNRKWGEITKVFLPLAALGALPSQTLMTIGTRYSSASNAAILVLALPIVTAFLAFLILKEKMNRIRWICFAIAIAGVVLCSLNDFRNLDFTSKYMIGNMIVFLAILANAFYNVGSKRIAHRFSNMEMVFYTYLFLIILLTPFVFYFEGDVFARISEFTQRTWIGMIALAIFHNFLSMVLFFKALKNLDATDVALSNYLIPLFGIPIAAFYLGEQLQTPAIIGGSLVLISVLILTIYESRAENKKP